MLKTDHGTIVQVQTNDVLIPRQKTTDAENSSQYQVQLFIIGQ